MSMITNITYFFALIASALWFAMAFRYFSFQHRTFAKVIIPKTARNSPLFETTAALSRFLGGMNSAFAMLAIILLVFWGIGAPVFENPLERAIMLFVMAAAHFSQFIFNVPILKNGERQGESYWYVMTGPMRFIFFMDAFQTIICVLAALAHLV
ncbi:MAG: hypothetical protein ABJN69_03210 [Hellea sp.]